MRNYTFNWEVQTLIEQFVSAFNDVIIKRYDNSKNLTAPLSGNKVRFLYSPKSRLYYNLNSPSAGGITVPVIAVNISKIERDSNRVFNKNDGFLVSYDPKDYSGNFLKKIPQPVPVNIGVEMTIVTKYQSDMDQILTNFIPYCDPYIIISWKVPDIQNSKIPYEIRSEVLWSGNVNLAYPDNLAPTAPYRIQATTSFTIKGWMFKKMDEIIKKIYTINSKYLTMDKNGEAEDEEPTATESLLTSFDDFVDEFQVILSNNSNIDNIDVNS